MEANRTLLWRLDICDIETVIVDEIHAVADDKRWAQRQPSKAAESFPIVFAGIAVQCPCSPPLIIREGRIRPRSVCSSAYFGPSPRVRFVLARLFELNAMPIRALISEPLFDD
jgi:hypothetical protein